jgi:16S rRNA (guanine527-N7)-methyltransferase
VEEELRTILVDGASRMGIELGPEAVSRFATLLSLLQTWGKRINLTTRLEGREIVVHHFLDSLAGVRFLEDDPDARVIDLGAGAGFPSFPLKFALPGLRVTLVESVRKKVAFCSEVIRATGGAGIEAICGRGEDIARHDAHRGRYSWAVSRALASSAEVLKLAHPFLAPGGSVLIYKGAPRWDELDDLDHSCAKIGAAWRLHEVEVPLIEARRSLVVVRIPGG